MVCTIQLKGRSVASAQSLATQTTRARVAHTVACHSLFITSSLKACERNRSTLNPYDG